MSGFFRSHISSHYVSPKAYKVEFPKFVIKIKNQYFSSLVLDSCFIFLEVWRSIVAGSGDRLEFGGFGSFREGLLGDPRTILARMLFYSTEGKKKKERCIC